MAQVVEDKMRLLSRNKLFVTMFMIVLANQIAMLEGSDESKAISQGAEPKVASSSPNNDPIESQADDEEGDDVSYIANNGTSMPRPTLDTLPFWLKCTLLVLALIGIGFGAGVCVVVWKKRDQKPPELKRSMASPKKEKGAQLSTAGYSISSVLSSGLKLYSSSQADDDGSRADDQSRADNPV